jgi:hypothetical protein
VDIDVIVVDTEYNCVDDFGFKWVHIASDGAHVRTGDRLVVDLDGVDICGYRVVIITAGYSGTLERDVPTTHWATYDPPVYEEPPEYVTPPPADDEPSAPSFSSGLGSSPG